ncbi:hypothetical protein BWI17_04440 [Betaproteobacteria bacterium GR16-43]|nr:hypothetical protein BWI17_04440 [Betaproteobacteria bacterium GR16-43]
MRRWDELGKATQVLVALVLALLAVAVPEIAFLMMMGGVDLTWLVLLSFVAPLLVMVRESLRQFAAALRACVSRSLLARPAVFAMSAAFALLAFVLSGNAWITVLYLAPVGLSS